ERARHVRKLVREMLNSRGEWEPVPTPTEKPLREINVLPASCGQDQGANQTCRQDAGSTLRSILTEPVALEKIGHGSLIVLSEDNGLNTYGRAMIVAERLSGDRVLIAKWIR